MSRNNLDTAAGRFAPPETLLFAARLSPNRSLGPKGTFLLIGLVTLGALILAVPFIVLGAWPIGGFFGLDILALAIAFRINNQRARAYEEVLLSRIELLFRQVNWRGQGAERRFNPFWVRLHREEDPDYGVTRLALVERRRQVDVGAFLGARERTDFADALQNALHEARRR